MAVRRWEVFIWGANVPGEFIYEARGIISRAYVKHEEHPAVQELFLEEKNLPTTVSDQTGDKKDIFNFRILQVSIIYHAFTILVSGVMERGKS
jgi:hypothetical protein